MTEQEFKLIIMEFCKDMYEKEFNDRWSSL